MLQSHSKAGELTRAILLVFCVQSGHAHVVEGMFAVFCLGAMVAVLALPIETKGRSLQVKGCCTHVEM